MFSYYADQFDEKWNEAHATLDQHALAAINLFDEADKAGREAEKAFTEERRKEGFIDGIFRVVGTFFGGDDERARYNELRSERLRIPLLKDRCLLAASHQAADRQDFKAADAYLIKAENSSHSEVCDAACWLRVEMGRLEALQLYQRRRWQESLRALDFAEQWMPERRLAGRVTDQERARLQRAMRSHPEGYDYVAAARADRVNIWRDRFADAIAARELNQAQGHLEMAEDALLEGYELVSPTRSRAVNILREADHELKASRGLLQFQAGFTAAQEKRWVDALLCVRPVVERNLLRDKAAAAAVTLLCDVLQQAAETAEAEERVGDALVYWNELYARRPDSEDASRGAARCLGEMGSWGDAIALLQDYVVRHPDAVEPLTFLADRKATIFWPAAADIVAPHLMRSLYHEAYEPVLEAGDFEQLLRAYATGQATPQTIRCLADAVILAGSHTQHAELVGKAHQLFPENGDYLVAVVDLHLLHGPIRSEAEFALGGRALAVRPRWRTLLQALRDAALKGHGTPNQQAELGLTAWPFGTSAMQTTRLALLLQRQAQFHVRELKVLAAALELTENGALLLYAAGICLNYRLHERAELYLERTLKVAGDQSETYLRLAELYEATGRWQPGMEAAERAVGLMAEQAAALDDTAEKAAKARPLLLLGLCASRLGEVETAEKALAQATELDPFLTQAILQMGNLKHKVEDFGAAVEAYTRLTRQYPGDYRGFYHLGRTLLSAGQTEEAALALKRAVTLAPDAADVRRTLGECLLAAGGFPQAYEAYERAYDLAPDAELLFYLGVCAEGMNQPDLAMVAYELVLLERPDQVQTLLNLSALCGRQGGYDRARSYAAQALKVDPDLESAQWNLAVAEWRSDSPAAPDAFVAPGLRSGQGPLYAATILLRRGHTRFAWPLIRRAVEREESAAALGLAGIAALRDGDAAQANDWLNRAAELGGPGAAGQLAVYRWAAAGLEGRSLWEPPAPPEAEHHVEHFLVRFIAAADELVPGTWEAAAAEAEASSLSAFLQGAAPAPSQVTDPTIPLLLPEPDWVKCTQVGSHHDWEMVGGHWEGGIATITKVVNRRTGELGARKRLKPQLWVRRDIRTKFRMEARLLASLGHPHIVRVFPESIDDGEGAFVLEWLAGGSLDRVLKERGPFAPAQAVECALAAAEALAYYHGQHPDHVHMDVSTDNLLLGADGIVKLADFGMARMVAVGQDYTLTEESTGFAGKLPYAAPETLRHSAKPPGQASDQYSLGCVLYELLTGTLPLKPEADDADATAWGVLKRRGQIQPPARLRPVPAWLDALVLRTLSRNPEERFDAMVDLAEALRGGAQQEGWELTGRLAGNLSAPPNAASEPSGAIAPPVLFTSHAERANFGPWEQAGEAIEGGMAMIIPVRYNGAGPIVALKQLKPYYRAQRQHRERFMAEAILLAEGRSPYLVQALPDSLDYARCQYAMEWLPQNLQQWLRFGPLTPLLSIWLLIQVASALEAFGREGSWRAHLDLTPGNVLFAERGEGGSVRLADFGAAAFTPEEAAGFRGKPGYAAPEVLRGGNYDGRADQYSLGVLLHEMMTGQLPAQAPEGASLAAWAAAAEAASRVAATDGVSQSQADLLRRLLQRNPEQRFPDLTALLQALNTELVNLQG